MFLEPESHYVRRIKKGFRNFQKLYKLQEITVSKLHRAIRNEIKLIIGD